MIANTVETLLMLTPETFPVDNNENNTEMATRVRQFANLLIRYAEALDGDVSTTTRPIANVTPAESEMAKPKIVKQSSSQRRNKISDTRKDPPKHTEKTAPFEINHVIGSYVAKRFQSNFYRGQVRSIDDTSETIYFLIEYTDGDKEEMTVEEMCGT